MSHISDIKRVIPASVQSPAAYSADSQIADFILGITFEIWEQRQVEKILDYYAEDVQVFSLEGITSSASEMVDKTYATLESYPDRKLLGDEVITSGNARKGFSSHRIISPMTNTGASAFGPATGKFIQTMNVADCELENGRIVREWLMRDNLAMVRQLGILPLDAASQVA